MFTFDPPEFLTCFASQKFRLLPKMIILPINVLCYDELSLHPYMGTMSSDNSAHIVFCKYETFSTQVCTNTVSLNFHLVHNCNITSCDCYYVSDYAVSSSDQSTNCIVNNCKLDSESTSCIIGELKIVQYSKSWSFVFELYIRSIS